jgi:hypothetical protein
MARSYTDTTGRSRPSAPRVGRRRPRRRRRGWVLAAALVGAVVIPVTVLAISSGSAKAPPPSCTASSPATGLRYSLTPEQAQNAALVAAVAYRLGLPDHAVTVALATALQESELRNLPYGDRDSVGLFQQRPSQGWGTSAQLLDPIYATTAFYGALTKVAGWQAMAVTDAAQAVQHSGSPEAYAAWEDEARAFAIALTGEHPAALSCRFAHFGGAAPASTALAQAMVEEAGANLIGVPVSTKTGWAVASWAVAHAYTTTCARCRWRAGRGSPGREPGRMPTRPPERTSSRSKRPDSSTWGAFADARVIEAVAWEERRDLRPDLLRP